MPTRRRDHDDRDLHRRSIDLGSGTCLGHRPEFQGRDIDQHLRFWRDPRCASAPPDQENQAHERDKYDSAQRGAPKYLPFVELAHHLGQDDEMQGEC